MIANASQEKPLLQYFLLIVLASIPFWLIGGDQLPLQLDLPVSALLVVCPLIAATLLSYQQSGTSGVLVLWQKAFDYKKIKNGFWYAPILFLNPLIMGLSYVVMRLAGLPLPDPQIPWQLLPLFFALFFVAAMFEELGWMGYAIDPMQRRWGALRASIILGLVWAGWHLIGDLQVGHTVDWIVWHRLSSVVNRVLIVWLYNNTGKSVFGAILYHDMNNVSWALFPNYGSHYDPFVTAMITGLIAIVILFTWRQRASSKAFVF
jgi:membrane protease YdiL (CAAX protease family)